MIKKLLAVLMLALMMCSAYAGQGAEYVNAYFELWLKAHRFTDFERKADGIVFRKNGVVLDGEIYEAKALGGGKLYSVESRISVKFKDGRQLDDFVAGVGAKTEDAFYDSLQNFCLTTLHPIYAELFDHQDPHARKEVWDVNGVERRVFLSEWGLRGRQVEAATQKQVESLIAEEMKGMKLSNDVHWVKLVVSGDEQGLKSLVFTVDGLQNEALNGRLARYEWPKLGGIYMAKLFFVVGAH